jgi:8-oxo-dGTP diphosphatase
MTAAFTLGTFAIITDADDRVLLCLRQDNDLWNLPGGQVESSEAPWEAVIREVQEETGLTVIVEKLVGLYAKPEKNDLVFSYKCQIISGIPQTTTEAKAIAYFSIGDLPTNIIQKQVERIQDYFCMPHNLIMRNQ